MKQEEPLEKNLLPNLSTILNLEIWRVLRYGSCPMMVTNNNFGNCLPLVPLYEKANDALPNLGSVYLHNFVFQVFQCLHEVQVFRLPFILFTNHWYLLPTSNSINQSTSYSSKQSLKRH